MPKEIKDPEEFIKLSQSAELCRVKRLGETVKLKLRTPQYLYTYKATRDRAEDILKQIKCKTEEI